MTQNGTKKKFVNSYVDLDVYRLASMAMRDVHRFTQRLPEEERDLLQKDLRCASRSVMVYIGQAWAKRTVDTLFKRTLFEALGVCEETKILMDIGVDCEYYHTETVIPMRVQYDRLGAMLYSLITKWDSSRRKPNNTAQPSPSKQPVVNSV